MFEGIQDPGKGTTGSSDGAMQRPSWPHEPPTHRAGAVTPRKPRSCSSLLNGEMSENLFLIAIKKLKFKLKARKPPGRIIFPIEGGPQF